MYVEKSKIVNGIIKYVESVVLPEVSSDKGFQIILNIGINAVKANSNLLDKVFENDMFKTLSKYDSKTKMYDVDAICAILKDSIESCGYFPVKIPAISFISPTEKELKFSVGDVDKLKEFIV